MKRHPITVPLLLALCFFVGIGITFATGSPGYFGAIFALAPLVLFFRAVWRSRQRRASELQ